MAKTRRPDDRVEPTFGPAGEAHGADLAFGLGESDRIVPATKTKKKSAARKTASRRPAKAAQTGKRRGGGNSRGGGRRRRANRRRQTGVVAAIRRGIGRVVYWGVVLTVIVGGVGLAGVGYYASRIPAAENWTVPARAANVRVLAANGALISNRADTAGVRLSLDELPPYLAEAVITIEDRRYYWHFGLDPIGLVRALMANWQAGRIVQGGSTITQQLAKNLFLKPERTLSRKVQEVILATWLEAKLSKREILELYLNRVYLGAGAYGVDAAAYRYFGKSARNITLGEAATLAALLKAPATYSPISNPEAAEARTRLVLMAMHDAGFISARETSLALSFETVAVKDVAGGSGRYVVDWVLDQLPGFVGVPTEDIIVTTSIDPRLQDAAARAIAGTLDEFGQEKGVSQGALVAIDPSGAVRAMVGGRDYAASQFNRAVDAHRQPGSAFKPFVYLTALENGLVPESVRVDQPVSIDGWQPQNYAKEYRGPVTLQTALALSLNTVSVQLTAEFGPRAVAATARRMGVTSPLMATPSIALGTSEVTPLELTAAYVPFSNGGRGVIPHVIRRITTADGKSLYERTGSGPGQVVDPVQVGMMNAMLTDTLIRGTGRRARLAGWPAAGKTGTSQDFRDAWFVGYTGVLTAGVWFGNDDASPTNRASGGNIPAIAWQRFMSDALDGVGVASLPGSYVGQADVIGSLSGPDRLPPRLVGARAANDAPLAITPQASARDLPASNLQPPGELGGRAVRLDRGGFLRRLFGG